jgi:ATP-binding cassette subfamily B protein
VIPPPRPPHDGPAVETPPLALLRKAYSFVAPVRRRATLVVLLAVVVAGFGAAEPLAMKPLFDELGGPHRMARVVVSVAALLAIAIARELLNARLDTMVWRIRLDVHYAITAKTVERLHNLPLSYHHEETVGGLLTKLDRGINGGVAAFAHVFFQFFPSVFFLVISLTAMVELNARLAAAVLLFLPLPPLIGALAAGEQAAREKTLTHTWAKLFSRLGEVLSGIVVVKSFVLEEQENKRFLDGVEQANGVVLRGVGRDSTSNAAQGAAVALARIATIGLGGWMIAQGQLSLGSLVAFLAYVGGVYSPIQGLTGIYQTVRRGLASLEIVFGILDAPDALADAPNARVAKDLQGTVEFSKVSFAYRSGAPVLHEVSLRAVPGETVALVGASGSGKTTAMRLLQRLYDPCSGSITIDGVDLRAYDQRSLRRHIGAVPQDGALFSDTVRQNIAFGRPGASDAEIERAARIANAHDFIVELPQGYATPLGEGGKLLSAGQRQRVAIARALLRDPRILVFDEPTSALDAESEARVEEALRRLSAGRTTFIIAHRLSTIMRADQILAFRGGRIVEAGRHEELVMKNGYYAQLVRIQHRASPALVLSAAPAE